VTVKTKYDTKLVPNISFHRQIINIFGFAVICRKWWCC